MNARKCHFPLHKWSIWERVRANLRIHSRIILALNLLFDLLLQWNFPLAWKRTSRCKIEYDWSLASVLRLSNTAGALKSNQTMLMQASALSCANCLPTSQISSQSRLRSSPQSYIMLVIVLHWHSNDCYDDSNDNNIEPEWPLLSDCMCNWKIIITSPFCMMILHTNR